SEMVLFAVGRIGATDDLDLAAAGLAADDRGRLQVDGCFATAVPHIYAAGDVIGYPSLAAPSSEQGRLPPPPRGRGPARPPAPPSAPRQSRCPATSPSASTPSPRSRWWGRRSTS